MKDKFLSNFKNRLKHNYGDITKILYECEHEGKVPYTAKYSTRLPITIDTINKIKTEEIDSHSRYLEYEKTYSKDVKSQKNSRIKVNKRPIGSAYFRGITRDRWQNLFNKTNLSNSFGSHNPKYSAIRA